ncbi:MAG: YitT family protein [Flavobacteriaceae bacterium]|nr:YitT family protein [Flavobacteriaceae bacterium]
MNTIILFRNRKNKLLELKSYSQVFLGSLILAVGYSFFIVPHDIVPGGIIGLSIVIHEITGISVGVTSLFINMPLLLWGTKVLGKKTGFKTAFSMILVSFFIDATTLLIADRIFVKDVLVSAIFGGVLIGSSVSIVMNAGATTGGNDILVRIISKKIKLPFSQLILIIDGIIVLLGVIIFQDFTMAAYCIIAIVAISKTIDYFIKKNVQNKTILIFSTKNKQIQKEISNNKFITNDIVKLVHLDSNKKMTIITKSTKKLFLIENIIYTIDPNAYITILESKHI